MFQDRRSYARRKEMLSFKVHFGDAELSCLTTDISPTGAFFAARNSPPIGEEISVDVRPTGVKIPPVRLKARVVRVNPLGGALQPGFAVCFVSAQSDVGGASIYHVLRRVLQLPDIAPDDLPKNGVVIFRFPEVGEQFDLQSARAPRPVTTVGSGTRLTGRPPRPIQDAMPRDRRGFLGQSGNSRSPRPSEPSRWATTEEAPKLSSVAPRGGSAAAHPDFGVPLGRIHDGRQTRPVSEESTARLGSRRASVVPQAMPSHNPTAKPHPGAARAIIAEPSNAFADARPVVAADSGIFSPPGGGAPPSQSQFTPNAPLLERTAKVAPERTSAPRDQPAPPPPRSMPDLDRRLSSEASFRVEDDEHSGFFRGGRPETSRIVAPFSNQATAQSRHRTENSTWSVYESDINARVSARRTSDVIIQDDPFAAGARKAAAKYREKAEKERGVRREQREREREQLRTKLADRNARLHSGGFSVDGDGDERSMIFARSGQASTIGGPMLTGMGASPALPENATVAVQTPVTYELDGRFVAGTMVSAAPLAVEIHSVDQVPQLDQRLVLNMPIRGEQRWHTIYLMGKLLRVPEHHDGGQSFVLHIERVQEGELTGAYNRFLTQAHVEGP